MCHESECFGKERAQKIAMERAQKIAQDVHILYLCIKIYTQIYLCVP